MHNQRVQPPRPAHALPKPNNVVLSRSPAALHGATSAFLPKPSDPTVSESSISVGARLAAFAAGAQAQRRTLPSPRSPPNERSRSQVPHGRGLPSPSRTTIPTGNLEPPASSSTPDHLSRPPLQSRSSSTLAAQRASAQSISPQSNFSKTPNNSGISVSSQKNNGQYNNSTHAVPETMASVAAKRQLDFTPAETPERVRDKIRAFEDLPSLSRPEPSVAVNKDMKHKSAFQGGQLPQLAPIHFRPTAPDSFPSQEDFSSNASPTLRTPTELSRRSSGVSATVSETAATRSTRRNSELLKSEYLLVPVSHSGQMKSQARNAQHHSIRHQDEYRSAMTVNALADAMVASSLASSRAASPSKRSPPPTSRRRSRSVAALHDLSSVNDRQTTVNPRRKARAMKHTLRKQVSSDEEETELTKRGRRHWVRKHPHMHSEGNRKRWRDKVTELERKRYEGVFAANRGSLIGSGYLEPSLEALSNIAAPENRVLNIVVRDIWERSRLPREVLREIYDLVSPGEDLALSRDQFVVGLWLIDQRLKGRKLPVKVSPSVWDSVRHSQGIKIRR